MIDLPENPDALAALGFAELVAFCCVTPEVHLRSVLEAVLVAHGFTVTRDTYRPYGRRPRELCNLLFVRGTPRVGLVAHTDVCRDHQALERGVEPPVPTPVLELRAGRRILIDRARAVQLGGDDRLGVAIALWTALHTQRALALLLTTDEEVGLRSARACRFAALRRLHLLVAIDRGNATRQLVDEIGDVRLCRPAARDRLLAALAAEGMPREPVEGRGTDVLALVEDGAVREAINLTCGYHDNHGADGGDFIDLAEAEETVRTVAVLLDAVDADWEPAPMPPGCWPELEAEGGPGEAPFAWACRGALAYAPRPDAPFRKPSRAAVARWCSSARAMAIATVVCLLDDAQLALYAGTFAEPGGLLGALEREGFAVVRAPVPADPDAPLRAEQLAALAETFACAALPVALLGSTNLARTEAATAHLLARFRG